MVMMMTMMMVVMIMVMKMIYRRMASESWYNMVVTNENFSQLNSWGRWFGEKFLKLKTYYLHFVDWPRLNGFHWFFMPFHSAMSQTINSSNKTKILIWNNRIWTVVHGQGDQNERAEVEKTLGIFGRSSSISLCRAYFGRKKTFSIIPFFPDFHRSQHRHYPGKTFPILITFQIDLELHCRKPPLFPNVQLTVKVGQYH